MEKSGASNKKWGESPRYSYRIKYNKTPFLCIIRLGLYIIKIMDILRNRSDKTIGLINMLKGCMPLNFYYVWKTLSATPRPTSLESWESQLSPCLISFGCQSDKFVKYKAVQVPRHFTWSKQWTEYGDWPVHLLRMGWRNFSPLS
jgi:hypothetical protein